jgi:hypothetical protein
MPEERVLNEAQISMGVSLPLNHKDVLKMFFVMVGRGIPVAEVIDILAEIHDIKAPARQQWEYVLPERECRGCGIMFQPLSTNQTYHNVRCQQDATSRRQSDKTRQKHRDYLAAEEAKAAAEAEALAVVEADVAGSALLVRAEALAAAEATAEALEAIAEATTIST